MKMDKTIDYKNNNILFKNLLQTGYNMDKFIIEGTIFSRPDHKYELFYNHLKPGDIVWDIGAYIGTFAIPFSITGHKVYEYVSNHNIPDPKFVKIDIEGNESLALLEMKNVIENIRPIWQIGYHHPGKVINNEEFPKFIKTEDGGFDFQRFEELDYIVYNLKTRQNSKFKWGDCNGEYMCIPKERVKL